MTATVYSDLACFLIPIARVLISLLRGGCNSSQYHGLIIPKSSGKTHFVSSVDCVDYCLIDIEHNLNVILDENTKKTLSELNSNSQKLHLYPKALNYLNELKKSHKKKKLIILSSDIDLVRYLGIKEKNIHVFIPSVTLSQQITASLQEEQEKALFENNKLNLILKFKDVLTYDTFADLQKEIMNLFKSIKLKI